MGRPNTLTETCSGSQYNLVTGVSYNAANQPLSYGTETWTYNVPGRITLWRQRGLPREADT
jgi:hypothetical protein